MAKNKVQKLSIKVDPQILKKVKRFVEKTKQYNIGNFYDVAAEEKLKALNGSIQPVLMPSDKE